jgi:hypothetical protein
LSTEYEQLLGRLIEEKKAKLEQLRSQKGREKQIEQTLSDIRHIEVEIEHYQRSLKLFRTKNVPKVGRWGRPETEEHDAAPGT